jgi:hypothetical protein
MAVLGFHPSLRDYQALCSFSGRTLNATLIRGPTGQRSLGML